MARRSLARVAIAWFVCAAFLGACGDGDEGGTGDPAPSGEPCLQSGFTETNCQCAEGGIGRRACTAELVFTECSCPPPVPDTRCASGDPLECVCPDQTTRTTTCLDQGTFDCPCDDAGPASGDDAG